MTATTDQLPIREQVEAANQDQVVEVLRQAEASGTAVYPIGGGTSLDFGAPAAREGIGLQLGRVNSIVDYPARDMTITVEAGMTMEQLAQTLAGEGQRLPVEVPDAARATIGGVVATGWNGPRRYGLGSLRDYVIGISAVDGRGRMFHGGGRVVKNVAGYDFCKLLTGSLGTLGVITQLTLRLRPIPEQFLLMVLAVADLDLAEQLLAELVHLPAPPAAIELVGGPAWQQDEVIGQLDGAAAPWLLVVALEGTASEVKWMADELDGQWERQGLRRAQRLEGTAADQLWQRLIDFSAARGPLVLKASVPSSNTTRLIFRLRQIDTACSIQAHAGNGVVFVRFSEVPAEGISPLLLARVRPLAVSLQGNVVVLSAENPQELTRQCVWGGTDAPLRLMAKVKQQFDPKDLLNPGRFVYP